MGWDYWKTIEIVIEYMENHKLLTITKEFSIESCIFSDIKLDFSEPAAETKHRVRVFQRLRSIPIPEPIVLFYNNIWNAEQHIYIERVKLFTKDIENIRRILLKTSFQLQ